MKIFGILIKRVNDDWCSACGRKRDLPERVIEEATEGLHMRREKTIEHLEETRPYSSDIARRNAGEKMDPLDPTENLPLPS